MAPRVKPPPRVRPHPTTSDIARRAYELYEARGGQNGAAHEDWLQAERELRGDNEPQAKIERVS